MKTYHAIVGEFVFETALHVGQGESELGTDAPLRRNLAGKLIIPATTIAGVLRTLATRLGLRLHLGGARDKCFALCSKPELRKSRPNGDEICGCAVCHLFGELYPNEKPKEANGGRASRLWVYDARLLSLEKTFVRDGVGIDRTTGAAASAESLKYDTEIIPQGARFKLHLELEHTEENDHKLLAAVLAEWQSGRLWMGGNVGRGLGRSKLTQADFIANDLKTHENLLLYLNEESPEKRGQADATWLSSQQDGARSALKSSAVSAPPFVEVQFTLSFNGPFLTNDTMLAAFVGYDHVSLLDGLPQKGAQIRPILPGSALRGVLRSHAERIARTLATRNAFEKAQKDLKRAQQEFLQSCPACNPAIDKEEKPLTKCDKLLSLANVSYDQEIREEQICLSCQLFGSTRRGSRLKIMDAPLANEPVWKPLDFLAIDRFTGGGLEGAKFAAVALWRPQFSVSFFLEEPQAWELGWLALVWRDLIDGCIPIGFGSAKGFGQAAATNFKVRCAFASLDDWNKIASDFNLELQAHQVEQPFGFYRIAEFDEIAWQQAKMRERVQACVAAFHKKVRDLQRGPNALPELKNDSYFNGVVDKLYPIEEA